MSAGDRPVERPVGETGLGRRLAGWVSRLVRIPSVSPAHAGPRAGIPGEARLAAELAELFRRFGGEVFVEEPLPGRPNVYGLWRGRTERWAAVDAHLDTVSVEQMAGDPFSGEIAGGRVYGRGAVDTKATLGVALALLEGMAARGMRPRPNLLLAGTIDEEYGAAGAPAFAAWLRRRGLAPDELAVAEPTLCRPVIAHKGVLRLRFTVEGAPAHSSRPRDGRNAIAAAAHLVQALEAEDRRLQSGPAVPGLGAGTLTVTLIEGGRGQNVVPDRCTLVVDRRLVPGEEPEAVAAALAALAQAACPLPCRTEALKRISPFAQSPDDPWVRRLVEWSGHAPDTAPYCTNAWAYAGVARACVVLGPGSIQQAHGEVEWVEIAELERLAALYARWWEVPLPDD